MTGPANTIGDRTGYYHSTGPPPSSTKAAIARGGWLVFSQGEIDSQGDTATTLPLAVGSTVGEAVGAARRFHSRRPDRSQPLFFKLIWKEERAFPLYEKAAKLADLRYNVFGDSDTGNRERRAYHDAAETAVANDRKIVADDLAAVAAERLRINTAADAAKSAALQAAENLRAAEAAATQARQLAAHAA